MNRSLFITLILTLGTSGGHAQVTPGYESVFQQSFEGMFDAPDPRLVLNQRVMEPNPPVPLDGGVVLLLIGGVALARKRSMQ